MQAYVNLRNRESAIWTLTRDVQVLAIGTVMFTLSIFSTIWTPMYTKLAIYPRKENFSEQGAVY